MAAWRERMGTDQAKAIYKERAATAECVNAHSPGRGLLRLLVRGLAKIVPTFPTTPSSASTGMSMSSDNWPRRDRLRGPGQWRPACANPRRLQQLCDGLSAHKIDTLLRKWLSFLPHPFIPKDCAAGYRYDVSILQAEFSLTQVLDRPRTGRVFFEEVIRENLDIGRPDHVQLIFRRRITKATPGRFRTRVITEGVTPSLHIDYKRSQIKQYHKEGLALLTETTINNPRDFNIGKRLSNLPALRRIGFQANRRLLDVQRISQDCALGEDAFQGVNEPIEVDAQRASVLRYADMAVQALFSSVGVPFVTPRFL